MKKRRKNNERRRTDITPYLVAESLMLARYDNRNDYRCDSANRPCATQHRTQNNIILNNKIIITMEETKYLKMLCKKILADKFAEERYRSGDFYYGRYIETSPVFCSYGRIGYEVTIEHNLAVKYDWELEKLYIDDLPYKEYFNRTYLEDNDVSVDAGGDDYELEYYTDAGGDMIISLDKLTKERLQAYIDNFDIDDEVMLWWGESNSLSRAEKGLPFNNIREHYDDLEDWLKQLQRICDKMPY